ncbi:unnamed protein product, partial [Owenia fusiformis]
NILKMEEFFLSNARKTCPFLGVWPMLILDDLAGIEELSKQWDLSDHNTGTCLDCRYACSLCYAMDQGPEHPNCTAIGLLLIEAGQEVNLHNGTDNESTPLHCAVRSKHDSLAKIRLLISHGVDVNSTNEYGKTALHLACRTKQSDVVDCLLEAGAEVDHKDCEEATPLFEAVFAGCPAAVQLLIKAGCSLDCVNEELLTPLDYAVTYQQLDIVPLLLIAGCRIDKDSGYNYYKDHYCNHLLYSLLAKGDFDNIKVLLECCYVSYESWIARMIDGVYVGAHGSITPLSQLNSVVNSTKELLQTPKSLRSCCRITVRRTLINYRSKSSPNSSLEKLVDRLPLPRLLQDFITFRENQKGIAFDS